MTRLKYAQWGKPTNSFPFFYKYHFRYYKIVAWALCHFIEASVMPSPLCCTVSHFHCSGIEKLDLSYVLESCTIEVLKHLVYQYLHSIHWLTRLPTRHMGPEVNRRIFSNQLVVIWMVYRTVAIRAESTLWWQIINIDHSAQLIYMDKSKFTETKK